MGNNNETEVKIAHASSVSTQQKFIRALKTQNHQFRRSGSCWDQYKSTYSEIQLVKDEEEGEIKLEVCDFNTVNQAEKRNPPGDDSNQYRVERLPKFNKLQAYRE